MTSSKTKRGANGQTRKSKTPARTSRAKAGESSNQSPEVSRERFAELLVQSVAASVGGMECLKLLHSIGDAVDKAVRSDPALLKLLYQYHLHEATHLANDGTKQIAKDQLVSPESWEVVPWKWCEIDRKDHRDIVLARGPEGLVRIRTKR